MHTDDSDSEPVELAGGANGLPQRDFPVAWGKPPGEQFSEERAAWVRDNVAKRVPRPAEVRILRPDTEYV